MSGGARPFFPWVGGKEKLAPYVYQVLPPHMRHYIEPFGGSGAVLLGLPPDPARLDIYNDLDADLVNLILCAKERPNALMKELKFLPIHARKVFEMYRDFVDYKDIHDENLRIELEILEDRTCFTEEQAEELQSIFRQRAELYDVRRAAAFYNCIRGSFSGTVTSFGVKTYDPERFLHLIHPAARRLREVVIENKNALQLIRERDRPGGVIYSDPPYYKSERLYRVSRIKKNRKFHVRLWQIISGCHGYMVLSYNDCPFIRKLYQDYYILAFRRHNPLAQKKGAEFGELIITNYDPRPYMAKQLTLFDSQNSEWEMELVNIPKVYTKKTLGGSTL